MPPAGSGGCGCQGQSAACARRVPMHAGRLVMPYLVFCSPRTAPGAVCMRVAGPWVCQLYPCRSSASKAVQSRLCWASCLLSCPQHGPLSDSMAAGVPNLPIAFWAPARSSQRRPPRRSAPLRPHTLGRHQGTPPARGPQTGILHGGVPVRVPRGVRVPDSWQIHLRLPDLASDRVIGQFSFMVRHARWQPVCCGLPGRRSVHASPHLPAAYLTLSCRPGLHLLS